VEFEEDEEKHIELCEIYLDKSIVNISFDELKNNNLVIEDISNQLTKNIQMFWKNNKLIIKGE